MAWANSPETKNAINIIDERIKLFEGRRDQARLDLDEASATTSKADQKEALNRLSNVNEELEKLKKQKAEYLDAQADFKSQGDNLAEAEKSSSESSSESSSDVSSDRNAAKTTATDPKQPTAAQTVQYCMTTLVAAAQAYNKSKAKSADEKAAEKELDIIDGLKSQAKKM